MAITSAQVQQLYVAYLGRAADKTGLDYWLAELNATPAKLTLENLRANFVNEQPEYTNQYAGLSRSDTVTKIYNNLFGRAPDAEGLAYWTTGGGASVNSDQLLTAFVNGASANDAKVIANKVLVSEVYTSAAGSNYTLADAKAALVGVDGTTGSVADAIENLDTLPGLAIPAGLAAVKAAAIAEKAVTDLETNQITTLTELNKAIIALNAKLPAADKIADADLAITGTGTDGAITYGDADDAIQHAQDLRDAVSPLTTASLQAAVTNANTAFNTARSDFTKASVGNVDLAVAYEKAAAANAALTGSDSAAVTLATQKVQVDFAAAASADATALATANTAAGTSVTNAATLYAALTDGTKTAAQIKAVSDAFATFLGNNGATDYSALKSLAGTDYTKNVAVVAEDKAEDAVTAATGGTNYLTKFEDKAEATDALAHATAADALVSQAAALTAAHDAAVAAADGVTVPSFVHDFTADTSGAAGADLFYFADGVKAADDFNLAAFNKGDALYIGEGYTLNSNVTFTTDANHYAIGTNTAAKEIYFTKNAVSGFVEVNIETNAVGHTEGTGTTDNVAVITLTGVTSLTDVSFANGVVTSNHVAA